MNRINNLLFGVVALIGMAWFTPALVAFEKKTDNNVRQAVAHGNGAWTQAVAEVQGEVITREELADELIATYGQKQLELLIHRKIIEVACKKRGIVVTQQEMEKEVDDSLKNLNLTRKEFVTQVLSRRGMTYAQHIRDNIWPKIALMKLVSSRVDVTAEDLKKGFEATYGAKVDARMLIVPDHRKAQEFWEQVNKIEDQKKKVEMFESIVKNFSVDSGTRAYGGQTHINRHSGHADIEEIAFALKPGELSKIVQVTEGHLILLCVGQTKPVENVTLDTKYNPKSEETVGDQLRKRIYERKLMAEITSEFQALHKQAEKSIHNYLSGDFDADRVIPAGNVEPAQPEQAGKSKEASKGK